MSASAPPPGSAGRGRTLTVVGAAVSVVAVVAVVVWALQQKAPELPTSATALWTLAGAIALYGAATLARGERWVVLLRRNGATPERADAYGLVAVGFLGNNLLPARAGDAVRAVFMAPRAQTGVRTVIGTLLAERLMDVVVLVGLFFVLAYGALSGVGVPSGGRLAIAAVLAVTLVGVGALVAWIAHRRGRLARFRAFVAPMLASLARLRGRHLAEVLALTLLVWSLEVGVWWSTARSVGLDLSMLEAGYVLGVASLFVLVPAGPGYAGTLDAAVIFGVRAVGGAPAAALSYLLLLRFVLIVPITLAGLVVLVARYGGLGRLRAAAT